jgi:gamma-glutamyltranspeptidase / glutathione hydrolase
LRISALPERPNPLALYRNPLCIFPKGHVLMPKPRSALSPNISLKRTVRKPSARSRGGIVVTQNRMASEAGARVLKAGGHAVDAAVAAAMTVGVAEPWMSGIGGVGAMLVYEAETGKIRAFDGGGRSPKALRPGDYELTDEPDAGNLFGWPMVKGNINTVGARAVIAPTQPALLALAHNRYGTKRWRDLLKPAITLAEEGLPVDWHTALVVGSAMKDLQKDPGARAHYLPNSLPPYVPAAMDPRPTVRLPRPDLARTLKAIAADGAGVLYKGPLARTIAEDVQALGGYLSEEDLAAVAPPECEPLTIPYFDRTIHVLPELNGGPTLAVAFRDLVKRRKKPESKPNAKTFLAYAEAMQTAWKHRFKYMGDAGEKTAPTCTTHICVVDREGNMVTLTQTLLTLFGARIVLPQTGILMNNGINWFDPTLGGPNAIAPDARALANYVPAVMTGGDATIAIGGCGGRRILPAVFQLLAMSADFGFDLEEAFHEPRLDISNVTPIVIDRRMPQRVIDALTEAHKAVIGEPVEFPSNFTIAGAVRRARGRNEGATEPNHPWSEAVAEHEV